MLRDYIAAAMKHADYERLSDGTYFGRIPGLDGAWANAESPTACAEELRDVLEEWIVLRLTHHLPIPDIDGHTLAIRDVA
jgi:predicted RNase H-like HicB family nuclease